MVNCMRIVCALFSSVKYNQPSTSNINNNKEASQMDEVIVIEFAYSRTMNSAIGVFLLSAR